MSMILDHVNYVYGEDTPLAVKALDDICLTIPEGQFIGVIGHTGSGKSTLMQHLNGLVKATSGHIYFSLKDETGVLSCVMFAGHRRGLSFRMKDGDRVVAGGTVDVYERDGRYQLYAKEITLEGLL